jgi:hypothetical protein
VTTLGLKVQDNGLTASAGTFLERKKSGYAAFFVAYSFSRHIGIISCIERRIITVALY